MRLESGTGLNPEQTGSLFLNKSDLCSVQSFFAHSPRPPYFMIRLNLAASLCVANHVIIQPFPMLVLFVDLRDAHITCIIVAALRGNSNQWSHQTCLNCFLFFYLFHKCISTVQLPL